ncbi:EamA family transporter RarD [Asticcacaulis sp. BYS171W]|uniref:EamA family transporter RarD n=1 Tax=Asticcacaulis aquaticus TaxID=2984212 RepID=A0ABT5HYS8_9CAUL|nr:EamA family transporter RarD [Asticcacaulis aquaticus]MDC7685232.1 EamA family transporter RarD [Asticcacaulis aquaticus]
MSTVTPTTPSTPFFASPIGLAVLCYAVWGFAPLIYLPMKHFGAEPLEIMAHRSLWAVLWSGGLVLITKQFPEVVRIFLNPKVALTLLIAALMIAINWGVFVWAVTHGHTIESALGYYLNPLINMAAGALLFKERLDNWGKAAIGLAVVGVGVQAAALGHVPYIALTLAVSFATYGIIRKQLAVSALAGLFVECVFLFIPSIVYLVWFEGQGAGHFFDAPMNAFWFALTGPVTVLPLFLFSYVARRLPLSTMGFIQFLAPTIAFFIGLFQGEPFTPLRALSFVFIWGGALVFAFGAWRRAKAMRVA